MVEGGGGEVENVDNGGMLTFVAISTIFNKQKIQKQNNQPKAKKSKIKKNIFIYLLNYLIDNNNNNKYVRCFFLFFLLFLFLQTKTTSKITNNNTSKTIPQKKTKNSPLFGNSGHFLRPPLLINIFY